MNIHVHILDAGGRLSPFKNTIETVSKSAIAHVTKYIPVDNIDIVFYDNPKRAIEYKGFGGSSITHNLIMISVNPEFPQLEVSLKEHIVRTFAHELYHCIRGYCANQTFTLFEALINEGLADHFDIEINKSTPEKWDTALNPNQLQELIKRAEKEFNNNDYNHRAWFIGSTKLNIPHWAGYSIGFQLVGNYLQKHPDKKPSNLYSADVKEFL